MVDELATAAGMGKMALAFGGGLPCDQDALTYDLASYLLGAGPGAAFDFPDGDSSAAAEAASAWRPA